MERQHSVISFSNRLGIEWSKVNSKLRGFHYITTMGLHQVTGLSMGTGLIILH